MKIFIVILMMTSQVALAITKDEVKDIAKQFENRNWLQHSVKYAREGRLAYYSDLELIALTKDYSGQLAATLQGLDVEGGDYFFPELGITTENTPSMIAFNYLQDQTTYGQLEGMSDLFAVLGTERWNDPDEANCDTTDPVSDVDCGRQRKMQWIFNHLDAVQRENLPQFKQLVLTELAEVSQMELGIPASPEAARIYQVLLDPKSIQKLFSEKYASYSDELDGNVQLRNQIAILQSALYQAFVSTSGKLETSELDYVELEKGACLSLPTELEINQCVLDDLKITFANYETGSPQQTVQNLMLDRKFLKIVVNSILENANNDGITAFGTNDLLNVSDEFFRSLGVIYQTDYVTYDAMVSDGFQDLVKKELMGLGEYLLTTEDILSLQLSKSLQKLLVELES